MNSSAISEVRVSAEEDALSLASTLLQRLGGGDADALAQLFAESIDWYVPGDPTLPWTGRRSRGADVPEYFRTLWSHLEHNASVVHVDRILVDGADAVILLNWSNIARDTGRRFDTPAALHLTVIDTKIVRLHLYEDTLAVSNAWAS
jgi:ketosteroid isomerase-like protein